MDKKEEKILTRIGIVLIGFLFFAGAINNYLDYKTLLSNASITIGKISSRNGIGGKRIIYEYSYSVRESNYKNQLSFSIFSSDTTIKVGEKYYVVYSLANPRLSTLIYELPRSEEGEQHSDLVVEDVLKYVQMLDVSLGWKI